MTRITASVVVDRPPTAVFALLVDVERLPDWAAIVVETADAPDPPLRVGSTFRQMLSVAGIRLASAWQVTAYAPPHMISYRARAHFGGRLAMRQTVVPEGHGSRVSLEVTYALPGGWLGALADRLYVARHNQRAADRSLRGLKRLLEQATAPA